MPEIETPRVVQAVPVLLVVDDDVAVLSSLKFALELDGFFVRLYSSGKTILEEPDLPETGCLLVDYYMPDMTGLELIAELRRRDVRLPAILMTGHPNVALRQRAAGAGVPLLEKPLREHGFVEMMRKAMNSS